MTASGEWRCATATVAPGQSAKFRLECGGRAIDGFIVNHDGAYHAYVNRCPHVGTPLDLWPNEFHTEDRRALICSTHAAVYEPDSGLCTGGPCVGDHLTRLPLRHEGAAVIVSCPAEIGGPRATRSTR